MSPEQNTEGTFAEGLAVEEEIKCPKCGSSDTDKWHHKGNYLAPECDYFECSACRHQWGHS